MIASWVHGRVGAFYAQRAGEGNEILQIHLFKSMEHIPGYTSMCVFLPRSRVSGLSVIVAATPEAKMRVVRARRWNWCC